MWKNISLVGGRNPISTSVRRGGSLEEVAELIEKVPDQLLKREKGGMLPLHTAAASDASREVVEILATEWPRGLREKDDEGRLPLHLASQFACAFDMIQFLAAKHPMALQQKDFRGRLPLHMAAQKHASLKVVKLLGEEYPEALLEEDSDGCLPLHLGAHDATLEVVDYLASKEPQALRAKDHSGRLALHHAAQHATLDVVQFLLEREPKALNKKDLTGWLPLHLAAATNGLDVVKFLLDKFKLGATVRGYKGCVPLQHAAATGSLAVVKLLLAEHPQAIKDRDDDGWLPVHNAVVYNNDVKVVEFLVRESPGTLWEGGGKKSRLALDLAQKYKRWEAAAWLKNEIERVGSTSVTLSSSSSSGGSTSSLGGSQSYLPLPDDSGAMPPTNDATEPTIVVESSADIPIQPLPVEIERDRAKVKSVVEMIACEPALISQSYIESIRTDVLLGRGFFGTVYKGTDSDIGHDFAIKVINLEILAGGSELDREGAMRSFRREQEVRTRWRVIPLPFFAAILAVACASSFLVTVRLSRASGTRTLRRFSRTPSPWMARRRVATTSCTSWPRRARWNPSSTLTAAGAASRLLAAESRSPWTSSWPYVSCMLATTRSQAASTETSSRLTSSSSATSRRSSSTAGSPSS
jgi:ankyrin repeat protein